MRNNWISFFVVASVMLTSACTGNSTQGSIDSNHTGSVIPPARIQLTEQTMPALQKLDFEKVLLPDSCCDGSAFFVYENKAIVEVHRDCRWASVVSLYDMQTRTKIGEYIPNDIKPNQTMVASGDFRVHQLIHSTAWLSGNKLYVLFVNQLYASVIDLDEALKNPADYEPLNVTPKQMPVPFIFSMLDEKRVIYDDVMYFNDGNGLSTGEGQSEFVVMKLKELETAKVKQNTDIMVTNVSGAYIASNIKRGRVLVGDIHKPRYRFFDSDMHLLKEITGPEPADDIIEYREEGKLKIIDFVEKESTYNIAYTANGRHAVFQNVRSHGVALDAEQKPYGQDSAELFVFNWEGELVARFEAKGTIMTNISIDSRSQYLYATVMDGDGHRSLCRAKINIQ